ncbi:hypothetical protein BT96DRAFT_944787 [Gymnopus androsaceus JB14]|uniref:Uncharacterized protein n=1 Tax=Gymnopus androsaceus JB14 TaxID=1447944 RepID=A0A6A4H573_9AGAR|nr:hypothetical protein BT96DRAFT_944787 [Gymnopus androsaceus JB14]
MALPHFIALKDQVRGEVASLSDLALMVDPDTLPTDSKQEVIVEGQVWRMPTCRIREVRFGISDSLQSKSRSLYSDNGCEFSLYMPIHNNWESYLEGHVTNHFLLGDELVSLEFYIQVWRSDPDLTYAEIERGVVTKVAPERYCPHRGCISRNTFTTMLKRFTTFKDPYGQNETVFDQGSGRVLMGKRNIVEETSFVLWFTSTVQNRELVWLMNLRMFTRWIDCCCDYEWVPQHSARH